MRRSSEGGLKQEGGNRGDADDLRLQTLGPKSACADTAAMLRSPCMARVQFHRGQAP